MPPWQAPLNRSHHSVPASATHRHKSIPLPAPVSVACPHDAIPSIQPVSDIPKIQSHCPDPASEVCPHGTPPQIDSIAPTSRAPPWHVPVNQHHRPDTSSVVCHYDTQCMKRPVAHSLNSTWFWIELPENCCEPLKVIMKYVSIQFCERPGRGRPFHALDTPHKSIPSPDPASFKFPFKCLNLTKITNWSHILYNILRNPNNE